MLKKILIAGAMMLVLETPAIAQQRVVAKACVGDIKTLCQGVQPGQGRIRNCIKSHFSDLSGTCRAVVMKAAAIGKACAADVKQNCPGVTMGSRHIAACMEEHVSDISDACKDVLAEAAASGLLQSGHRLVGWYTSSSRK